MKESAVAGRAEARRARLEPRQGVVKLRVRRRIVAELRGPWRSFRGGPTAAREALKLVAGGGGEPFSLSCRWR